jgi:hypothetical protein
VLLRKYKATELPDANAWRCLTVLWSRNWPVGYVSLQDGWTPLISASSNGHLPVVAALLDRGATVEAANKVHSQRGDSSETCCCAIIKHPSSPTHMPGGV